ncbi:peptide ABC transporter substrate-binding protein [Mesorhizobium sangaii]|uniref:Peptide/nickel transport system substrate-binding protein n=1 Tax=Mesorhizobium sangaii TaxID=505389 RepID=A0A841PEC0_9HYPH|nr:peptide ABC transporter substrate-binding protein [Mesorhizobium sangaii]MBB6411923.1 peptide/nickel transport system substrate-binding protein [Mesorhizobium sangaii]
MKPTLSVGSIVRSSVHLVSAAALLMVLVASAGPARSDQLDRDTLRLLLWQAPTTLNPHFADGGKDQIPSRISYEPLASFDRKGNLVLFLAAEVPTLENGEVAVDGKSVVWKLKQGVKWSDGEPFTAKDVVFTYRYITNPDVESTSGDNYKIVDNVEALDDLTVKVTFKRSNPAWAVPFVGVRGMILPEHVFAAYNNSNAAAAPANFAPVGTGPYIAKEFRKEDVLVIGEDVVNTIKIFYEPNPFYRDAGKRHFKRVTLQGGGDATVAAKAVLRDGVVDYSWNLQVDDETLKEMEAKGVGKVVPLFGAYVERIALNFSDPNKETADGERSSTQFANPFFSDKLVREAFAYAVDRDKIAALYGRTGQPASNLLVAPTRYSSQHTSYKFDLSKAAELLDDASWVDSDKNGIRDKNGIELSVVYQTSVNPVRQETQEIVSQALESLGVHVEKKTIDSSVFFSSTNETTNTSRQFYADMEEYAHGNKVPDPGAEMSAWICSEIAQVKNGWSSKNISRYCNGAYDALYERSTIEMDPQKRQEIFIEMNDLLVHDFAMIPLVHWADTSGIAHDIGGYDPTSWDSETWNIADWYRKL